MRKEKPPRKRRAPVGNEPTDGETEIERQTQEKAELVPPARRPPTAVGTGTPPPPPPPPRPSPSASERHRRPTLFRALQAVRAAVGVVLDLADAAAEALTKGLQPRV